MSDLTWEQKLRAMQVLSGETYKGIRALEVSQSVLGGWVLNPHISLGGDGFLRSRCTAGNTQQETVEKIWDELQRAFARGYYAVVSDRGIDRGYRWEEFMWVEVPPREDLPAYRDSGR